MRKKIGVFEELSEAADKIQLSVGGWEVFRDGEAGTEMELVRVRRSPTSKNLL